METYSLNGTWQLAHSGFDWKVHFTERDRDGFIPRGGPDWVRAQVPGDVHLDYQRAGLIDDPFFGRNADHCLWMEGKNWWYRRTFVVPDSFAGKTLYLHFEGLDCFATIYLNGDKLGEHENMFTPCEFDVTRAVTWHGENELIVRLGSPLWSARQNIRDEQSSIEPGTEFRWGVCTNEPPNVYTRKAAMSYGWDVAPRLLTIGIWKDVELRAYDEARIADVHWHTDALTPKRAEVSCTVELQREQADSASLQVEVCLGDLATTVPVVLTQHQQQVRATFGVDNPCLWWPNGYGAQHLYSCSVRILCDGKPIDQHEFAFGIRTVELVQEPQDHEATSFFFRVNGIRIFAQGFNWMPPDAIFARTNEESYREHLLLVRDCGAVMLRVIGIGVYEQEAFYRLCDEYGILIWQDFMLTNFMYPQWDRAFMTNLREEVRHVVRSLRNHACLALWCGDNESDMRWRDWTEDAFHEINRALIPNQLRELDPDRPYRPSSPHSLTRVRDGHQRLSGDDHYYSGGLKPYAEEAPELPFRARFLSEVGVLSCPALEELRLFLHEDELWPVEGKVWRYHATDTRLAGPGWGNIEAIHRWITTNGLPKPQNISEFVAASQEVQAQALVDWFWRMANDPECGGMLFFVFADNWPQVNLSVVGYPRTPKPAYWALREAFRENLRLQRERLDGERRKWGVS